MIGGNEKDRKYAMRMFAELLFKMKTQGENEDIKHLNHALNKEKCKSCFADGSMKGVMFREWATTLELLRRASGLILSTKHPHEDELDDIRVGEEELGAAIALGSSKGVTIRGSIFGKEDVFKGP